MTTTLRICGFCLLNCLLLTGQLAQGQVTQTDLADQARVDLSTPAMKYFGRGIRTPTVHPRARHRALPTKRYQLSGGKPFQNVSQRPSISPYLGLDMFESSVGLPNYYSRVLPKIQQQEANEAQAAELRRLQQQVRLASAPGTISNNRNGGIPTTGRSTQFMNSGGYFPSIRR